MKPPKRPAQSPAPKLPSSSGASPLEEEEPDESPSSAAFFAARFSSFARSSESGCHSFSSSARTSVDGLMRSAFPDETRESYSNGPFSLPSAFWTNQLLSLRGTFLRFPGSR